ncbi:MAG TPA: hypothetical protein VGC79_21145 [Polyangiaceae bacterium]
MNPVATESVARAQRAVASARALFREGLVPECHEYMLKALSALIEAWQPAPAEGDSEQGSKTEQALRALEQALYRRPERLRAAIAAAEKSPPKNAAKAADFSRDSEWLWAEIERLNAFSVRYFRPAAESKRRRIKLGIALGLVAIVALVFQYRLWGRVHATASAVYGDEHLTKHALDGLEGTEWLLPDGTTGWIDLIPPKPRTLHRVYMLNAHNEYWLDRGSHKVRVTAYSEAGPVGTVEGAFPKFTQDRSILELPLEAENVVRVRIEVLSFFKRGGGFAEVELR